MPDSHQFIIAENRFRQKILLNPQDVIGRTILNEGLYDKTGLYFIENILSRMQQPLVFDIGASIGNHALRMSAHSQMVYLFEPQTLLADYLQQTMALNQLSNWQIHPYGLSNENQTLTLYQNLESNIETSFVPELKSSHSIAQEALVRKGDEVVEEIGLSNLDFIKIDVEGFEAKVIQGLANSILKFRPLIFMEWDKEITKAEFQKENLFSKLFKDYQIKAIQRNPEEASLYKKIRCKIRRLISADKKRRRRIIGHFDPQHNYRHIILIPQEKINLMNELYL